MPQRQYEWMERIKDVEREHTVMRLSIARLMSELDGGPLVLPGELRFRDVRKASERLDGTFIIRLFAEFETGLRFFWTSARTTDPPGRTRDLLDGVAATRRIPHDTLSHAHDVRDYRNHLVHERDEPVASIAIADARRSLCIYFSFLPLEW